MPDESPKPAPVVPEGAWIGRLMTALLNRVPPSWQPVVEPLVAAIPAVVAALLARLF